MAVSKRLRFEIFTRDNHACRYCGATAPDAVLTVDHVIPVVLGGTNDPTNLVTACKDCNAGKASVQPGSSTVADVAGDAVRWRLAMEEALEDWRCEHTYIDAACRDWEDEWGEWKFYGDPAPLPPDWRTSVSRWLQVGFGVPDLVALMPAALERNGIQPNQRFRYYCGVVWKTLAELQAKASSTVAADPIPMDAPALQGEGPFGPLRDLSDIFDHFFGESR